MTGRGDSFRRIAPACHSMKISKKTTCLFRIQESLNALLGCLFKLFFVYSYGTQLAICRQHRIEVLLVLLHHFIQIILVQAHDLGFIKVGEDESDEFVAFLYDDTFNDHRHGIQLILDFLAPKSMFLERPLMNTLPSSSIVPRSPVWYQPSLSIVSRVASSFL